MPGYNRLRLPERYRALRALTARDFAWEWLRRNSDFRAAWAEAAPAARRAAVRADEIVRRSRRELVNIPRQPGARRWSHWGLCFRAAAQHWRC